MVNFAIIILGDYMIKIRICIQRNWSNRTRLERMNLEHEILFAIDNGNIEIEYDEAKELEK